MFMKRVFNVILTVVLLAGCQDQLSVPSADRVVEIGTKSGVDEYTVQTDEPYVFLAEKDFTAWTDIIGLENRFKACEVPETVLSSMTTEALVRTVINYPLNYIIFAYDNPLDAVNTIVENSPLHQELLLRPDAIEILGDCYARLRPSISITQDLAENRYDTIPLESDCFLGYFLSYILSSESFDNFGTETVSALQMKKHILERESELYGEISLVPVAGVLSVLNSGRSEVTGQNGLRTPNTVQVYTPFLQELVGEIHTELSPELIAYMDNLAQTQHPNATMLGHSSARYNSHSYAWHLNSTSNTVWLERNYGASTQLNKYWVNDLYTVCVSSEGQKVSYDASDSALICSNGKHRSKWGQYPLMEHAPTDCPYSTYSPNYYKEKSLPIVNDNVYIYGSDYVNPNVTYYYTITFPSNNNVAYHVTAESLIPGNTCSLTLQGGSTYLFSCSNYGAYKIYVRGNAGLDGCYNYSNTEKLVVCMPSNGQD